MDIIDLGKMTKKKRNGAIQNTPTVGNTAVANSQNHGYVAGKSREQGANGVTQANKGWMSQYAAPTVPTASKNNIINSLTRPTSFTMPKIQHSLLTNEGFNEALGVVGARNRAKLDMQNRRVLGGVLGSIIAGDTQRYGADKRFMSRAMEDATRRRGQDLDSEYKTNALEETKAYHKVLGKYYTGQNQIGTERNKIAAQKAAAAGQPKQLNPLDVQIKRQKLVESGAIIGMLGADQYNALPNEKKKDIIGRYIQTGALPTLSGGATHWYGDTEPTVTYSQHEQTAQGQQVSVQPKEPKQQETPHYSTEELNTALSDFASKSGFDISHIKRDGDFVVYDDGAKKFKVPVSGIIERWRRMNGN